MRATAAKLCPAGYHCGANTAVDVLTDNARTNACPAGYESALLGLETVAECQHCAHGKYCVTPALASYTSACATGYYCDNEKDLDDKAIAPATSATLEGDVNQVSIALKAPFGRQNVHQEPME